MSYTNSFVVTLTKKNKKWGDNDDDKDDVVDKTILCKQFFSFYIWQLQFEHNTKYFMQQKTEIKCLKKTKQKNKKMKTFKTTKHEVNKDKLYWKWKIVFLTLTKWKIDKMKNEKKKTKEFPYKWMMGNLYTLAYLPT